MSDLCRKCKEALGGEVYSVSTLALMSYIHCHHDDPHSVMYRKPGDCVCYSDFFKNERDNKWWYCPYCGRKL
jgi:hypothetical protein